MWRNLLPYAIGAVVLTGSGTVALRHSPVARAVVPAQREPTRAYIEAVERLLRPPGELVSLVVASIGGDARGLTPQAAHNAVKQTGDRVTSLRALPLRSPTLRAQRARIVTAIAGPVVATMSRIATATDRGDKVAIAREGRRLIREIKELPSLVVA